MADHCPHRLVVSIRDPATGVRDIWIFDLLREDDLLSFFRVSLLFS